MSRSTYSFTGEIVDVVFTNQLVQLCFFKIYGTVLLTADFLQLGG